MAEKKPIANDAIVNLNAVKDAADDVVQNINTASKAAARRNAESAEKVVKLGTEAVREFWETGSKELRDTQNKFMALSREASDNLTRTTKSASQNLAEALNASRENVEAWVESSNVASDVARNLAEELYSFANATFANNVEHSKNFLEARTVNDVIDLQNKFFQNTVDLFFNQSAKMSKMAFRLTNDAVEPIQNRAADATKRFSKALAS